MRESVPLLQLALDMPDPEKALALARQVADSVDLIEAGTPLILMAGLGIVRKLRKAFPNHTLVADVKVMDAGKSIAGGAYDAGADIVTVMAAAPSSVLTDVMEVAHKRGNRVMLDLLGSVLSRDRIDVIVRSQVNAVCIHRAHRSIDGMPQIDRIAHTLRTHRIPFAVAGGLDLEMMSSIVSLGPHIVIVGSAITGAEDPVAAAGEIRRTLA